MNKKTYLVTGANGYIGRYVVKALLEKGQSVVACDFNYDGVDERATKLNVDIFSGDESIYNIVGRPDVCIHLAWRNGFVHNADSHILDLPNHYIFIKNMIEGGLKHIVVMGSMHEVGYWEGAIDENTPCNPLSLYGVAKNSLRQLVLALANKNDMICQWIRAYYILGDDLKNSSIFSKITQAELDGKESFPFTLGKNKYDFINVNELAEQIVAVAMQEKVNGIINCCSGNPVTLAARVEQFISDNNYKIKLEYGAFPDRPYDSPGEWGDSTKIRMIMEERE